MPARRMYPDELRERAVKMELEVRERQRRGHGEIAQVARQLNAHPETLRTWVRQAEIDGDQQPTTATEDSRRIKELE
jgi:transposase